MQNLVFLTGAGISAESGLSTFRDNGGLWDKYPIEEVATIDAWKRNPKKVNDFYNLRRQNCYDANPNNAHRQIAELEDKFHVNIVTQNIDNLHERAGSKNVLHLHGLITNSRSSFTGKVYPLQNGKHIKLGEKCPNGFMLRPDVVWFGEEVPNMITACKIVGNADILVIIGTSLQVYPAAGLINATNNKCKKFILDPNKVTDTQSLDIIHIRENASTGIMKLIEFLL